MSAIASQSRTKAIVSWVIRILLAAAFLGAASAKLAGVPMMVDIFAQIGLGQWFRIFTALVEIVGVIVLFVPNLTVLGALWLGATMVGAFLAHVFVLHSNPAGAVILFTLSAALAWLQRADLAVLRARFL